MENGSFCERVQNFKMAEENEYSFKYHSWLKKDSRRKDDLDYYNSYVTPEALNGNPYTMVSNVYIVSEF